MAKKNTLENLDTRLTRVEEIIPTLATKADLEAAITTAVAPLATKAELAAAREELVAMIAPLPTRSEVLALHESVRQDIQLLAESVLSLHARFDAR